MPYLGNDLQVAQPSYRNIDDISGSFNSSTTSFPLLVSGSAPVPFPINSNQCLISVAGVVQRPDDSGTEGFRISGGNIIFSSAPNTGADFFGVILAGADYVNVGANFPSGSAAVPSITFDSDLDTGIYNSAANQVSITTAGTERLRIDSAGQIEAVSLGTAGAPSFSFATDPNTGIYSPGADQVAVATNGTGRLFISADGVATGGAAQSGYGGLQVRNGFIYVNEDGANTVQMYLRTVSNEAAIQVATNHPFKIQTNNQEHLRITSAGLVGIGTSSPVGNLDVTFSNSTAYSSSNMFAGGISQYIYNSSTTDGVASTLGLAAKGSGTTAQAAISAIYSSTGVGHLAFGTRAGGNVIERMRLTSTGLGVGTTSPGSPLTIESSAGNQVKITYPSIASYFLNATSGGDFAINKDGTERARIDSSGRLLVGTSSARANYFNSTATTQLQIEKAGGDGGVSVISDSVGDDPAILILGKSNNASLGGNTAVAVDNFLGTVSFQGNDGTEFVDAARISCYVDGTPGANDMPGRLVFSTTADGASSPTERMRIGQNGQVLVAHGTSSSVIQGESSIASAYANSIFVARFTGYSPNTTSNYFFYCEDTISARAYIYSNGGLANYQANDVNLSDRNVKKDISPAADTWNCLKEWEIVNYRYKDQPDDADLNFGVIAQQVAESCPEVVTIFQEAKEATEDQPAQEERLGVREQQMYWMAIKALQEAQVRIEQLEAKVAALESA